MGRCSVCGETKPLTFEHVPPEAAFNDWPAKIYPLGQWYLFQQGERARYHQQQRGSGYTSLCAVCNNERGGDWYVPEFLRWVRGAAQGIERSATELEEARAQGATARLSLTFKNVSPCLFLKQVTMMFLAINEPSFGDDFPELRDFVLDRSATGLGRRSRFFLHIHYDLFSLHTPRTPMFNIERGIARTACEILFPPFGYSLAIDDTVTQRDGEITTFATFEPDYRANTKVVLPVNEPYLPDITDISDLVE